jgi:tripartite-type tricarboxylate transporter receptor subunit TctC
LQSAAGRDLIARQSAEAGGGTPEDAAAFVRREIEKWKPVIEAAKISLN